MQAGTDLPSLSPLRIAALQPSISLILEHLDALDTLVACTKYCLDAVPALRSMPMHVVHDSWSSNTDEILAAQPNLVVASVPYRMDSLAAILKAGCPVVTLAPHTLTDVYADIRLLGNIVGRGPEATDCIRGMQEAVEAVRARTAAQGSRPLVYCEEWGKPLIHSQPWVAELIEAAGGYFLGTPGKTTEAETVARENPDVLLFAWCGAGDRVPLERVIAQHGWQDLPAVRQRRVYCIPDEFLNTPGPNLIEGLHALASAIHPEIFGHAQAIRQLAPAADPLLPI